MRQLNDDVDDDDDDNVVVDDDDDNVVVDDDDDDDNVDDDDDNQRTEAKGYIPLQTGHFFILRPKLKQSVTFRFSISMLTNRLPSVSKNSA